MADSDHKFIEGMPVVRSAFDRTVRLVASARLRDAVLAKLADDEAELAALAEIEGATSGRLKAQDRGAGGLSASEMVHGVPHARISSARCAYWRPKEPNRFNGTDRGAWYAALIVETCIAEVGHHLTAALSDANDFNAVVDYAEMFASMAGEFVDLRGSNHHALSPDKSVGYPAGNALAATARVAGINGIIYPSVRHAGGTCIAALWPHAVQSVAQGEIIRLTWSGTPEYDVSRP